MASDYITILFTNTKYLVIETDDSLGRAEMSVLNVHQFKIKFNKSILSMLSISQYIYLIGCTFKVLGIEM